MEEEIGTLNYLNVKPGDVVEWNDCRWIVMPGKPYEDYSGVWAARRAPWRRGEDWLDGKAENCRIVSRAPDTPKLWRDMTPEEKGSLLLAHHEGKVIQYYSGGIEHDSGWTVWEDTIPTWYCNFAYRVKPEPFAYRVKPEPKVEVVTGSYWREADMHCFTGMVVSVATHRITFNLIDGIPDCSSIKMEPI